MKCWLQLVAMAALFSIAQTSQAQDSARGDVGRSLKEAQALAKAGRAREALGKIAEAEAYSGLTAYETYLVHRTKGSIAASTGDNVVAARSFEVALETGNVSTSEALKLVQAIAGLYYRAKEYQKAGVWAIRYHNDGGADPAMRTLLVQALSLGGECDSAFKFIVEGAVSASEGELQVLANCYLKRKDGEGYLRALEKLNANYPKAEYADGIRSQKAKIAGSNAPAPQRVDAAPAVPGATISPKSFGTGVFVNADGFIATNHHVIDRCASIRASVRGKGQVAAQLVASDARNDTALIRVQIERTPFASMRTSPARAGESVIAIGFPLTGLLASEANVATGTIAATAGIRNDMTRLQISAPIQPGNSGGPLLDESESLLGIVVSKLNASAIYKATGDIPQNINFAVKAEVVRFLLDANGVSYQIVEPQAKKISVPDLVERAKGYTVLIECN